MGLRFHDLDIRLGLLAAGALLANEEDDAEDNSCDHNEAGDDDTGNCTSRETAVVLLLTLRAVKVIVHWPFFAGSDYRVLAIFRFLFALNFTEFITVCFRFLSLWKSDAHGLSTLVRGRASKCFIRLLCSYLCARNIVRAVTSMFLCNTGSLDLRNTFILQREQNTQHLEWDSYVR